MAAYSQDLRDRVLDALSCGDRPNAIALRFMLRRSWVYRVRERLGKNGWRTASQIGGYRRSRMTHLEATWHCWIQEQADLTLAEMRDRLSGLGIEIKIAALRHQLNKWGLSLKNASRQCARTRRIQAAMRYSMKRLRHLLPVVAWDSPGSLGYRPIALAFNTAKDDMRPTTRRGWQAATTRKRLQLPTPTPILAERRFGFGSTHDQMRSMTVATPCPTPMHIVHSA